MVFYSTKWEKGALRSTTWEQTSGTKIISNMHRFFFFGKASPRKAKKVDLIYFFSEHFKEDPYAQTASENRTLSHQ